jgi:hypothetical protein
MQDALNAAGGLDLYVPGAVISPEKRYLTA